MNNIEKNILGIACVLIVGLMVAIIVVHTKDQERVAMYSEDCVNIRNGEVILTPTQIICVEKKSIKWRVER